MRGRRISIASRGLLFAQGIRGLKIKTHYNKLKLNELVTGDGRALPPRLLNEIAREIMRLASKTDRRGRRAKTDRIALTRDCR
jgi:hypothetical protein